MTAPSRPGSRHHLHPGGRGRAPDLRSPARRRPPRPRPRPRSRRVPAARTSARACARSSPDEARERPPARREPALGLVRGDAAREAGIARAERDVQEARLVEQRDRGARALGVDRADHRRRLRVGHRGARRVGRAPRSFARVAARASSSEEKLIVYRPPCRAPRRARASRRRRCRASCRGRASAARSRPSASSPTVAPPPRIASRLPQPACASAAAASASDERPPPHRARARRALARRRPQPAHERPHDRVGGARAAAPVDQRRVPGGLRARARSSGRSRRAGRARLSAGELEHPLRRLHRVLRATRRTRSSSRCRGAPARRSR